MKKMFFNTLILLLLAPASVLLGQSNVYISKSVLKTAEWANFEYKDVLKKAIAGDVNAITQFFKFNNAVDGVEGIDHNITCLELIPLATDKKVANALMFANPKLKKVVLDRIILAQGRTQKMNLRKPMNEWAPRTWALLNGQPLPEEPEVPSAEMAEKLRQMKAAGGASDALNQPKGSQVAPDAGKQ